MIKSTFHLRIGAFIFWSGIGYITMTQSWAGVCPTTINARNNPANNGFEPVFNQNDANNPTIYMCQKERSENKLPLESDIIAGGSQAISKGNVNKTVDMGIGRIDIDGFDVNDNLNSNYVFRPLKQRYLDEWFHFVIFQKAVPSLVGLTGESSDPSFKDSEKIKGDYCTLPNPQTNVSYHDYIKNYFKANPQKFTVNGVGANAYTASGTRFGGGGNKTPFATATISQINGEPVNITLDFVARETGRSSRYTDKNGNIYCLVTVGVQAQIDLNTAKANKDYVLNVGVEAGD